LPLGTKYKDKKVQEKKKQTSLMIMQIELQREIIQSRKELEK